jgi:predicted MFS family arabinose efflux permease
VSINPLHFSFALTLIGQSSLRGCRLLLTLCALDLGASALMVGVLLAVFALMPAIVGWQVGRWTDRSGCFRPMLAAALLGALGFGAGFLSQSMPMLLAVAVLVGAAYGMFHVAQMNAVGLISTPETRDRNLANLSLMFSVTNGVAPLMVGLLIQVAGNAGACFWLMVLGLVTALMVTLGAALLPSGAADRREDQARLSDILREPRLARVLIIGGIVFAAIDVFQFYVPIQAHGQGISAAAVGVIMACFPAAAFISRLCLPWFMKHAPVETVLRRAFILSTAALLLMPFMADPFSLAAMVFVYGFGLNLGQPITLILAYASTTAGRSGEIIGVREALNQVTRVGAPVLFGAVGSLAGVTAVFVAGAAMLVSGALLLRSGRLS